jgi:hypothetical protein
MNKPFLTLPLRGKRDLLMARQRARQIARALGFDLGEQTSFAAAVFDLAETLFCRGGQRALHFAVAKGVLRVLSGCTGPALLEKPLPEGTPALAAEDLAWIAHQLTRLTPLNLFEEFRQQNQELLGLLHDVQALKEEIRTLRRDRERPAAA